MKLGLSHNNDKIIEFDQNNFLKGLEYISPIYNSILYKKALSFEYKSFKQDTTQSFILHPYFLKQYNNRWYVFGKNDDNQLIINLALDRIASIQEIKKAFIPNTGIDFGEYFEDIIGVTISNEAQIQNVILKVNNSLLPYITTKPIHGSQKIKEKGAAYTVISLQLIPNYELESLILSYGEGLEVLEPQTLREIIKKRVELISSNYQTNNADKLHE
jgi:predicted DNA-binding transcriptional regulator YafY